MNEVVVRALALLLFIAAIVSLLRVDLHEPVKAIPLGILLETLALVTGGVLVMVYADSRWGVVF